MQAEGRSSKLFSLDASFWQDTKSLASVVKVRGKVEATCDVRYLERQKNVSGILEDHHGDQQQATNLRPSLFFLAEVARTMVDEEKIFGGGYRIITGDSSRL